MSVTCAFRGEIIQDEDAVRIEVGTTSTNICPRCLMLITVHRRIHHMNIEKLIFEMA